MPKLRERVILVANRCSDPKVGAEVAHEDREDQCIRLVAGHLDEARRTQACALVIAEVAEVLHLEEPSRRRARDPGRAAPPRAHAAESGEVLVQMLESMLWKAVKAVVKDPRHIGVSLRVRARYRVLGRPSPEPVASRVPATAELSRAT